MVTEKNWSHTEYKSQNYMAKISFGGEKNLSDEFVELYFVSVFSEENLITEQVFKKLKSALSFINTNYSHWEFYDHLNNEKSSCSSCQAH